MRRQLRSVLCLALLAAFLCGIGCSSRSVDKKRWQPLRDKAGAAQDDANKDTDAQ